jgi:hypothetical protein
MPASGKSRTLKRKAFFVDKEKLRRAWRVLGAATDADAVRLSVERVIEMDRYRRMMTRTRASLPRGSFSEV